MACRFVRHLRAHDRAHALAEQADCASSGTFSPEIADRDVDVAAFEVDVPIVGRHVDLDVRMSCAERRQLRDQPQRRERHRRRDREPGLACAASDLLGGAARARAASRSRRDGKRAPAGVSASARCLRSNSGDAERVLERLHLARERRLREEQLLGRAREATRAALPPRNRGGSRATAAGEASYACVQIMQWMRIRRLSNAVPDPTLQLHGSPIGRRSKVPRRPASRMHSYAWRQQ